MRHCATMCTVTRISSVSALATTATNWNSGVPHRDHWQKGVGQ